MKRIIYLAIALICATSINAQVRIGNNTEPHKGAVLDLKSTETETKGLLLPSVNLTDINSFLPVTGDKDEAAGMVIYNTNETIGKGVYVWDGDKWAKIADSNGNGGDNGDDTENGCGAYVYGEIWLPFMCHNLGATETADPFTPSANLIGDYYQWGRSTVAAYGPIKSDALNGTWSSSEAASSSWTDGGKTTNDPCPEGWRIPTKDQWNAVLANNTIENIGTNWSDNAANYSTGIKIGDALFLPTAGWRIEYSGAINRRGLRGYYWSSTANSSNSFGLAFYGTSREVSGNMTRLTGMSVRCVAQ